MISIAVYIDSVKKLYTAKDIISKRALKGHRLNLYGPETVRNEAKKLKVPSKKFYHAQSGSHFLLKICQ